MRIPVKNTTMMPIYVGASMIPAGDTRDFEEADVPEHLRPPKPAALAAAPAADPIDALAAAPAADPIDALVAKPAKDVIAAIDGLSSEELQALEIKEEARGNKARSTVMGAITAEQLRRAEAFENESKN